jgi:hypothetical protein
MMEVLGLAIINLSSGNHVGIYINLYLVPIELLEKYKKAIFEKLPFVSVLNLHNLDVPLFLSHS